MPTKANATHARVLDPSAGESALNRVEPTLRAIAAADLTVVNADAQDAAVAALALVDIARDPARLARLKALPATIFAADTLEQLEDTAWALWFTQTKLQSESVQQTGVKVDVATYEASGQQLARMLKVLEYHVGHIPEVAAELADIRSGVGYQDRASDLVRTASLVEKHASELAADTRYYEANDATVARQYAETIIGAMRVAMGKTAAEWSDLRQRAWFRLNFLYNEVLAAAGFVFRAEPEQRGLFVPLRQVLVPFKKRQPVETAGPAPSNGAVADASGT
jgi:hypothetical protein